MLDLESAVAIYLAYLFGSLSSAIIVCRLMGLPDPRRHGSRNPGATNVLRIGGRKAALFTLLGDSLKGTIPVLLGQWYGFSSLILMLIGFAAFLGHLFPLYFRFEGGKGVATSLGVLIGLRWPASIGWIAIWLIFVYTIRYVSIGSMIAAGSASLFIGYFTGNAIYVTGMTVIAIIIVLCHLSNIRNLLAGKEGKIGKG